MCGFYSLIRKLNEVEAAAKMDSSKGGVEYNPTFKFVRGDQTPALLTGQDKIVKAQWGFSFDFSPTPIQNARKEKLLEKSSAWYEPITNGQFCVLPADSFYEFNWQDPKGKMKVPYRIGFNGFPLMGLAGLYRTTDSGFETMVITMDASGHRLGEIQNGGKHTGRAPFLIRSNQWREWMSASSETEAVKLIGLEDSSAYEDYSISRDFNKPSADPFFNWHQREGFDQQGSLF